MSSIPRLDPNSWPLYPGLQYDSNGQYVPTNTTAEQINSALDQNRLEDAKMAVYNLHGKTSLQTAKGLQDIIAKLAQLNKEDLSSQHENLGYTLDAAYSLGCRIYTIAINNNRQRWEIMCIAKQALYLVAQAYIEKRDYCRAIDALSRLDKNDKGPLQDAVLNKWDKYIKENCPPDKRERQRELYNMRVH